MKTSRLTRLLLACLIFLGTVGLRADEEQDLIGTLQSTATPTQKCAACLRLKTIATARSMPALAALLGDERVSQAARNVLETLPGPEAGAALREAVGRTSGLIQAGLLDSLGWRGEPESVPLLAKHLSNADATIAASAAAALGRISGKDATAALRAARAQAPGAFQNVLAESLLKCAERLQGQGNMADAAALHRELLSSKSAPQIRAAAWRGLVLSDAKGRAELIAKALTGKDREFQVEALKRVRELADPPVVEACRRQWASLPAAAQLAVMDAHVKLGAGALPTVLAASKSPHLSVRVGAWQALAELNQPSTIPALAKAAAQGEPAEREAARTTLARLHGPGVREALLNQVNRAEPATKAELLLVLGERGDKGAADVLLKQAGAETELVRLAALQSLKKLAVEETIGPLLELALQAKSAAHCEPILQALSAVCLASQDKEKVARRVVNSLNRAPTSGRRLLLPLLADLATPDALQAAQAASKGADLELAKEGIRVLSQWPSAAPAPHLLALAQDSSDPTVHALALRGCVEVSALEKDSQRRLALLKQAIAVARRVEEKRQVLGQLSQIQTQPALEVVLPLFKETGLENEAGFAALQIAAHLPWTNRAEAEAALRQVATGAKGDRLRSEAEAALQTLLHGSAWLAAGPYRQEGKQAQQLFDIPFAPEKPSAAVEWRVAPGKIDPQGEARVDLNGLVGGNHCVVYLKTRLFAPTSGPVSLAIASDDGLKLWVNGQLAHATNAVRGIGSARDHARTTLRQGWNELFAKVTQHTAGCGVVLRITDAKGAPIKGLRFDPQGDAGGRP